MIQEIGYSMFYKTGTKDLVGKPPYVCHYDIVFFDKHSKEIKRHTDKTWHEIKLIHKKEVKY